MFGLGERFALWTDAIGWLRMRRRCDRGGGGNGVAACVAFEGRIEHGFGRKTIGHGGDGCSFAIDGWPCVCVRERERERERLAGGRPAARRLTSYSPHLN